MAPTMSNAELTREGTRILKRAGLTAVAKIPDKESYAQSRFERNSIICNGRRGKSRAN